MATTDYANMHKARAAKDDEFYTRMDDVEAEMWYHRESLKGKRVYLNCDDPDASAFARYFRMRFKSLGLKRLVITGLRVGNVKQGVGMEVDANGELPLDTDGDCFSETNRAILAESDVVVTNPPFSLFRDYMVGLEQLFNRWNFDGSWPSENRFSRLLSAFFGAEWGPATGRRARIARIGHFQRHSRMRIPPQRPWLLRWRP